MIQAAKGTISEFPNYRPWGEPAWSELVINAVPAAAKKLTVNGTDFVAGTDFAVSGKDAWATASALARAINSDVFAGSETAYAHAFRPYRATVFGGPLSVPVLVVYGTNLGTLTITTDTGWTKTDHAAVPATGAAAPTVISVGGAPYVYTTANDSVTTANPGTTYVLLASHACKEVVLNNTSGTDIQVRRGGAGAAFQLLDGQAKTFRVTANSSELGVKRLDDSNTTVTLVYEYAT